MIGELEIIVLDTASPKSLADFYSEIAGLTTTHAEDDWITMATPEGWRIAFQQAPDHTPPRWPDPAYPQQAHLDLLVADLPAAVSHAERHGARRLPGGGDTYTVLADPSGHPFCLCQRDGVEGVRLADVCFDCPDAAALARFYAPLLGMEITYEGGEGAMLAKEGRPALVLQNVATYNAPRWPDPAHPQQVHLDVNVTDIDQAEPEALKLGATRLTGGGETFRVYADPVGHPFCLVW